MKNCLLSTVVLIASLSTMPLFAETAEGNLDEPMAAKSELPASPLAKINEKTGDLFKLSGLIVARAQYSDLKTNYGGMDIRFFRIIAGGRLSEEFTYRFQVEMAGSPRLLDAWVEWKKYDEFYVRGGQMKRCFGFETPWSPFTLGVCEYSQVSSKLCGFSDRVGEQSCGGRDLGVRLMGDLFKLDSHFLLHYDFGVYNGNGINKSDNNNNKDLMGTLTLQPVKNLFIGGGYWDGKYGPEDFTVDRERWTVGAKYLDKVFDLRAEYFHSDGQKLNASTNAAYGADETDGWYASAGMQLNKCLRGYLKYDLYRDDATNDTKNIRYMCALNWSVNKYLMFQANYHYTQAPKGSPDFNTAVLQMFIKL